MKTTSETTPRWICSVTFLKDGKYPLPPVTHTYPASGPHTAAARAIAEARRAMMRGKRIDHVTVKVVRARPIAGDEPE